MGNWSSGGLMLDVYDDIFFEHVTSKPELLEKVGSMQVLTTEKLDHMPDENFALVVLASPRKVRRFPIHDKEHVILAKEYFEKNACKLTTYMQGTAAYFINRACKVHGIEDREFLEKCAEERHSNYIDSEMPEYGTPTPWKSISISMLSDKDFAFVKTADNKTYRYYPIDTAANLHSGIEHFTQNYNEYRPIERVKIASAMIRKAQELEEEADLSVLSKYATIKPNPNFSLYMSMRKEILNDDTDSIAALEGIIEKKAEFKGQTFGRALEIFDEQTGLDTMWDVAIPDPYASCYALEDDIIDAYGLSKQGSVDEEKIKKLAESDMLEKIFSKAAAAEFRKDPVAIFNSLPAPTKQLLLNSA